MAINLALSETKVSLPKRKNILSAYGSGTLVPPNAKSSVWLKLNANKLKDFMLLKKISTSVEMTA